MSIISTEDIALFDSCKRLQLYSAFEPPRIPIAVALNESLRIGLIAGDPSTAANHFMERGANPGLAISCADVYSAVRHHSSLIELITAYLLASGGAWKPSLAVSLGNHRFKPLSFVMDDGRLRRVVLCSRWDDLRRREEEISWRSMADVLATSRPLLVNAISIGSAAKGFRPSVWTRAYSHPVSKDLRIKSIAKGGENFNDNWRRVYRESSSRSPAEWLKLMQADRAFDDVVASTVVDVPKDAESTLAGMMKIMDLIATGGSDEMTRSACYRMIPCIFSGLCYQNLMSPQSAGWKKRKALP